MEGSATPPLLSPTAVTPRERVKAITAQLMQTVENGVARSSSSLRQQQLTAEQHGEAEAATTREEGQGSAEPLPVQGIPELLPENGVKVEASSSSPRCPERKSESGVRDSVAATPQPALKTRRVREVGVEAVSPLEHVAWLKEHLTLVAARVADMAPLMTACGEGRGDFVAFSVKPRSDRAKMERAVKLHGEAERLRASLASLTGGVTRVIVELEEVLTRLAEVEKELGWKEIEEVERRLKGEGEGEGVLGWIGESLSKPWQLVPSLSRG